MASVTLKLLGHGVVLRATSALENFCPAEDLVAMGASGFVGLQLGHVGESHLAWFALVLMFRKHFLAAVETLLGMHAWTFPEDEHLVAGLVLLDLELIDLLSGELGKRVVYLTDTLTDWEVRVAAIVLERVDRPGAEVWMLIILGVTSQAPEQH